FHFESRVPDLLKPVHRERVQWTARLSLGQRIHACGRFFGYGALHWPRRSTRPPQSTDFSTFLISRRGSIIVAIAPDFGPVASVPITVARRLRAIGGHRITVAIRAHLRAITWVAITISGRFRPIRQGRRHRTEHRSCGNTRTDAESTKQRAARDKSLRCNISVGKDDGFFLNDRDRLVRRAGLLFVGYSGPLRRSALLPVIIHLAPHRHAQ